MLTETFYRQTFSIEETFKMVKFAIKNKVLSKTALYGTFVDSKLQGIDFEIWKSLLVIFAAHMQFFQLA